jgi:HEAT repeat protein
MSRWLLCCALVLVAATGLRCAGDIVEHEGDRIYTPDELRIALTSADFRAKNKARAQLDTLPPPQRLALLTRVATSEDPATRILAVVELAKLGEPAHSELARLAAGDPDPDVRELAGMLLEGDE